MANDPLGDALVDRAINPAAADSALFEQDIHFLRNRGCRCPLRWSGQVAIPATICDLTQKSAVCAKRMIVEDLADLAAVHEAAARTPPSSTPMITNIESPEGH